MTHSLQYHIFAAMIYAKRSSYEAYSHYKPSPNGHAWDNYYGDGDYDNEHDDGEDSETD